MPWQSYIPQTGDQLVPGAKGVTELQTVIKGVIAACGEAAVAAAEVPYGLASGAASGVTALVQKMVAAGQTVGGKGFAGQSTPANLQWGAQSGGLSLNSITESQALADLGHIPVVVGVNNGAALGDTGVQGHYVTLLGRTGGGNLIVSDPNSPQSVQGGLVVDTVGQLNAANPFWFGAPSSAPGGTATLSSTSAGLGNPLDGISSFLQGLQAGFKDWMIRFGIISVAVLLILLGLAALLFDRDTVAAASKAALAA